MSANIQVITPKYVTLTITSVANMFGTERRFEKDLTIAQLKGKIELLSGASSSTMKLIVYNKDRKMICALDNDDALLGSYPVENDMTVHIENSGLHKGEFEDVSKVEKFEISQEQYDKRTDSVRAFKERNKIGRFNEEELAIREAQRKKREEEERQKTESIKVGDRCEVRIVEQPTKRGVVKYVGLTDFKPGHWIGVQYDEPHGKNDGSVNGKQYFECPNKYGAFVKPQFVEVGDFPEEDFGLGDDEM
ncbi:tubulin-folding cofactor B-like [Gigantopelta aegis]|uniref:tubulin-folding cofactor B-like n=1 Tax=Gigantopelta aegis TaxID=1735272 RepID=UPI001B88CA41|nr:tubulin-folding cofactor B-like [Gigantopelta aegis]